MKLGRQKPRMSVNCLVRYLNANASQRRRLLVDQKYPRSFQTAYYREVEDGISGCLTGRMSEEDLLDLQDSLSQKKAGSQYEGTRLKSSVEAIDCFLDHASEFGFDDWSLTEGDARPPKMVLAGVEISVRPEVIITMRGRNGQRRGGSIKLYFGKNESLDSRTGPLIAGLTHQYAEKYPQDGFECDRKLCYVLDVFAGNLFQAPKAVKRARAEVEDACREIGDLWPGLSPKRLAS